MSDHYYSSTPHSSSHEQTIQIHVNGQDFTLTTDEGVFSKDRLDYGSKVLIETFCREVDLQAHDQVLELGSGYGPILIALAKYFDQGRFTGLEVNQRAHDLALSNAQAHQLEDRITWSHQDVTQAGGEAGTMDYVLTNPPIRAGKATIQAFADQAYQTLKPGGSYWVVIQRKQGAPSYRKYLTQVFGQCERINLDKGYWILRSIKQSGDD